MARTEREERMLNRLQAGARNLSCGVHLEALSPLQRNELYTTLLFDRLQRKMRTVTELWEEATRNWNQTFYLMYFRTLGDRTNQAVYLELARRVPYRIVLRERLAPHAVEAMLLGCSGLLDLYRDDSYTLDLRRSFEYLAAKYSLERLDAQAWELAGIRPANHPVLRLAQAAEFFTQDEFIMQRAMECCNENDVRRLFRVEASEYWRTHYIPGAASLDTPKRLGNFKANIIGINLVAGCCNALPKHTDTHPRMKRLPGCLLLLLLALCVATARAQRQPALGIAFYDLDGLYDTIPALFYDDSDHTPRGRLAWDSGRYRRKIAHTAAVIDSMGLPLVALYGVENEAVVRDLSAACRGDYSYLHSTMNAFDGLDFALLYYGDLFRPLDVEQGRDYLCIEGVLRSDTLALVLSCDYRMARWAVRELRHDRPGLRLLVAGRTPHRDAARLGLGDLLRRAERAGRGNVRYPNGSWHMRDRILADTAFEVCGADVYARPFLFDERGIGPLPTYRREKYLGGFGFSLPIFIYIR